MLTAAVYLYAGLAFAELFRASILSVPLINRGRMKNWEYCAFIFLWPVILTIVMMKNWNRG